MTFARLVLAAVLLWTTQAGATDFASPGGPEPANIAQIARQLRQDAYDLELMISFGTSKGGSAGHLALAVRDRMADDDLVYSANFYADRSPEHAEGFYNKELMVAIPKLEYLFRTRSSLGETAAFGLDFGEVYKRSVIGIRVYGVPAAERAALVAFFARLNDDFHARARDTEYHDGEIRYDYMHLNCAKTIGSAFKYGADYTELPISKARVLKRTTVMAAAKANIPTEMAMALIAEWARRGYGMDTVLYKKYPGSTYVDPHEEEKIAFKDLPNRFPSVISRDFTRDEGAYEDFDNLYAMYLLYNLGKYSIVLNEKSRLLEIEREKPPLPYAEAAKLAKQHARSDSRSYRRHLSFLPKGLRIGEAPDNTHLYHYGDGKKAD